MVQRRFHCKSGDGCFECKRNWTKCDEQRNRDADDDPESTFHAPWKRDLNGSLSQSNHPSWSRAIQLLESGNAGQKHEMQVLRDPGICMETMHLFRVNLAACGALHLALSGVSTQHHMLSAIRHHNTSVALFRPVLSTPAMVIVNQDAIFAFRSIIALYGFVIERLSASQPDTSPATRILQVLLLIRNSVLILKLDATGMTQSLWSATMLHPTQIQEAFDYILPEEI
ncbi:hypothetical protein BJX66DRAFT_344084 [Aspergillus keveii]|uniref:Zn(2)-C6 fungal-type domain-containing protein n=1 Tax=Aspergillus keveii TaxID=714993 RepID=A0ABR4FME3_9EURO